MSGMDTSKLRLVDIAAAYPGGIDALAFKTHFTRDQVWRAVNGLHLKPPLKILLAIHAEMERSAAGRRLRVRSMDFLALWNRAREARLAYETSKERPRRAARVS